MLVVKLTPLCWEKAKGCWEVLSHHHAKCLCWQSRSSAFPPAVVGLQYEPLDAEWCWKTCLHPAFGAINLLDLTDWQSAVLWNSPKQTQSQLWNCSQLDEMIKKEG